MLARVSVACVVLGIATDPVMSSRTSAAPEADPVVFDPDRVPSFAVSMAPQDWEGLRSQLPPQGWGPFGASCHPFNHRVRYRWFPAEVTIDGGPARAIRLRKKAYCGSQSVDKPGLKFRFSAVPVHDPEGRRIFSLTLNNAHQDASFTRQCLALDRFIEAGLPAPRCSFAQVTVNGESLGPYVVIEGISKRLGAFGERAVGPLFEATRSDFHPAWLQNFEPKNKAARRSPQRLELVAASWTLQDERPLSASDLAAHFDVDALIRFWALEGLLGAWDGFASHQNNYFVHIDPDRSRIELLPWSPDHTFKRVDSDVVLRRAWPTVRLSREPWAIDAFCREMRGLLRDVWDEDTMLEQVRRWQARLARGVRSHHRDRFEREVGRVREFIVGRRARVVADLRSWCSEGGSRSRPGSPPAIPSARRVGSMRLDFELPWAKVGTSEQASLQMRARGGIPALSVRSVRIGGSLAPGRRGSLVVELGGPANSHWRLMLQGPALDLQTSGARRVDYTARWYGGLVVLEAGRQRMVARLVDGELQLDDPVDGDVGDRVSGWVQARLLAIDVP